MVIANELGCSMSCGDQLVCDNGSFRVLMLRRPSTNPQDPSAQFKHWLAVGCCAASTFHVLFHLTDSNSIKVAANDTNLPLLDKGTTPRKKNSNNSSLLSFEGNEALDATTTEKTYPAVHASITSTTTLRG